MTDDNGQGDLFSGPPPAPPNRPGHLVSDKFHDDDTVADVRERLLVLRTRPNGVDCPCCNRKVAERERHISLSMANALTGCFREHGFDWFHPGRTLETLSRQEEISRPGEWKKSSPIARNTDFAKLRYWDIIEQSPRKAGLVGHWRITPFGAEYLYGRVAVKRACTVYNKRVRQWVDETRVTINDVELWNPEIHMRGVPPYGYWLEETG